MKSEREATPGAAAAETKMQDSFHFVAGGASDESLQPLLEALHAATMELKPVWEKADGNDYVGSYLHGFNAARDAAAELVSAFASSGPNGNEVGPAPLPVQGKDELIETILDAAEDWQKDVIEDRCATSIRVHLERAIAALRASSAPTTKG